jgi:hypothetical protein
MRDSRAMLYAQRLNDISSQLSELEYLRGLVEEAERRARGAPPLRLTRSGSRHLRSREPRALEPRALSVRLRRLAPPSRNAGAICTPDNDNQVESSLLEPFPEGWWASS